MKKTIATAISALGLVLSAQAMAGDDDIISVLPIASNVAQGQATAHSLSHNDVLSNNDLLSHNDILSNNALWSNNTANLRSEATVKAQVAATNLDGSVRGSTDAGNGGDGGNGVDDSTLVGVGVGLGLGLGLGAGGVGFGGSGATGGSVGTTTTNYMQDHTMTNAVGIFQVAQNGGMNAMAQQGVTVQANLNFSK